MGNIYEYLTGGMNDTLWGLFDTTHDVCLECTVHVLHVWCLLIVVNIRFMFVGEGHMRCSSPALTTASRLCFDDCQYFLLVL